jgi:peroxiredoxin
VVQTPDLGTIAPDFTLPGVLVTGGDATRGDYTLSALRGRPVVLAFYPGGQHVRLHQAAVLLHVRHGQLQ